jgi:hypothetical protein
MPRAKRALAEVDPNASRLASNPKSSKTNAGKIGKTADGGTLKGDGEDDTIRPKCSATQNKSSCTVTRSSSLKSPTANSRGKEKQTASKAISATNFRHRLHLPGSKYSGDIETDAANCAQEARGGKVGSLLAESDFTIHGQEIDYKTKDNSKLRVLLFDRCLSTSGSREELISRLEKSTFDYDTYSSERLVELLKERHLTNTALGSKAVKIQRLLLNDSLDRDTSNYEDMKLYVRTDVSRCVLDQLVAKEEGLLAREDRSYLTSTWTLGKLSALLKDRKLLSSSTKEEMITRLRKYDRKQLTQDISKARKELLSWKERLEAQIGHPVEDTDLMEKENQISALDHKLQAEGQLSRPGIPICGYNWRESHWASRTERELSDICSRRGMPGHGPRAALIKWLDTGSVEYEDLYAGSLEIMCIRRGIKCRSGAKKVDLIRRLQEADEQDRS